jgi:hypothetical protein
MAVAVHPVLGDLGLRLTHVEWPGADHFTEPMLKVVLKPATPFRSNAAARARGSCRRPRRRGRAESGDLSADGEDFERVHFSPGRRPKALSMSSSVRSS